jgi:hypothetical protein
MEWEERTDADVSVGCFPKVSSQRETDDPAEDSVPEEEYLWNARRQHGASRVKAGGRTPRTTT